MGILTVLTRGGHCSGLLAWDNVGQCGKSTQQNRKTGESRKKRKVKSMFLGKLTTPHDSCESVWGDLSAEKQTGIKLQL